MSGRAAYEDEGQAAAIGEPTSTTAFLLVPGFAMLAYAAAVESLRAANDIAGRKLYSWQNLTPAGNAAAIASNGIEIGCDCAFQSGRTFDKVFVCASDGAEKFDNAEAMAWLRGQAAGGASMGGIGGGAFLLARAGLLKGRRVTLHWAYATAFREKYPDVALRRSLYEIDGNIMTSGGGVSPLDMMHAIIRNEHGEKLATGVSDWFLHTDIREGQAVQRLSFQARLGVHHPGLIRALENMERSLEDPLSRAQLAQIAGVSERQLDRLFLAQVGTGLSAYYLKLRLERAKQLVLQSSLSLTEIAVACGFNSASTFSKSYRAEFGEPPRNERVKQLQRHRGR